MIDKTRQFNDTKGETKCRRSMKGKQHNDQKKADKRTNKYVQYILWKLLIEQNERL